MTSLKRNHQAQDADRDDSSFEGNVEVPVSDFGPEYTEFLDTLDAALGKMDRRCQAFLKTAEKLSH
jgi:hypothetical protein